MLVKALTECTKEVFGGRKPENVLNSLTADNLYELVDVFGCAVNIISDELGVSFNPQTGFLTLLVDYIRQDIESGVIFSGELLKDFPKTASFLADNFFVWCRELNEFLRKKIGNSIVAAQIADAFAVCKNFSHREEHAELVVYALNFPLHGVFSDAVLVLPVLAFTTKVSKLSFLLSYNLNPLRLTVRVYPLVYSAPIVLLPESKTSIERASRYVSDAMNIDILDVITIDQLTAENLTELINDYFERMNIRREEATFIQLRERVEVGQKIEYQGEKCVASSVSDSYYSDAYELICTKSEEPIRCTPQGKEIIC